MIRAIVILIFIVFPSTIFSQETKPIEAKNSIYFDVASMLYTGNYALNYERKIYSNQNYQSMISTGFGVWYSFNNFGSINLENLASSFSVPVTLNTILGTGKWRFECDFGVRLLIGKGWSTFQDSGVVKPNPIFDDSVGRPIFNVGYRYQKPNGRFIFRTFVGLGGFGLGIGSAF